MIAYNAFFYLVEASPIKPADPSEPQHKTLMTEETAQATKPNTGADGLAPSDAPGMLSGLTVIECADETAEYCGLLLAGLGAEVIKIEPPGGASTRLIAPFEGDTVDKERSLYFWAYNRGKRSVVLDLESNDGKAALLGLMAGADILVDSSGGELNQKLGLERPFASRALSLSHRRADDAVWR